MEDYRQFEVGDVVRLKTEGPAMTVVKRAPNAKGLVETAWFAEDGKMEGARLYEACLQLVRAVD